MVPAQSSDTQIRQNANCPAINENDTKMDESDPAHVVSEAIGRTRVAEQPPPSADDRGAPRARTAVGAVDIDGSLQGDTDSEQSANDLHALTHRCRKALAGVLMMVRDLYRDPSDMPALTLKLDMVRDFTRRAVVRSQFESNLSAAGCLARKIDIDLGYFNTTLTDHYTRVTDLRNTLLICCSNADIRILTIRGSDVRAVAIMVHLANRERPIGRIRLLVKTNRRNPLPAEEYNTSSDYAVLRQSVAACCAGVESGIHVESNDEKVYCSVMDGIADASHNRTLDFEFWNPGLCRDDHFFKSTNSGILNVRESDTPLGTSWLSMPFWTKLGQNAIRCDNFTLDGSANKESHDAACLALASNESIKRIQIARVGYGSGKQQISSWQGTSSILDVIAGKLPGTDSRNEAITSIVLCCKSINTAVIESILNVIKHSTKVVDVKVTKTYGEEKCVDLIVTDSSTFLPYAAIPTSHSKRIAAAMSGNYTMQLLDLRMENEDHQLLTNTYAMLNSAGRGMINEMGKRDQSSAIYLAMHCSVLGRLLHFGGKNYYNNRFGGSSINSYKYPRHCVRSDRDMKIGALTGAYLHIRDSPGLQKYIGKG